MSTRYLTLKQLQRAHACSDYVSTFKSLFPRGRVAVNDRTTSALAQWANFYFLEDYILTPKQRAVFNKVQGEGFGTTVTNLRKLVPGFDGLPRQSRDSLLDAFRDGARVQTKKRRAEAFNVAYNSPRK